MKPNWTKQATFIFVALSLLLSQIFTVTPAYAAASAVVPAPVLLAPANAGMTTISNFPPLGIPQLSWAAVTGTVNYRIQVSSDHAFTTKAVDILTPNNSYTPTSSLLFTDGDWYWHVRVETPVASAYSATWKFVKSWATPTNLPVLISPLDGDSIDFYDNPTFTWNPVVGAAGYRLQIYASQGGWSNLTYTAITLAPSHQPINKLPNSEQYYWRVIPMDASNHDGTPSAERLFIQNYNPEELTLLSPANNSTPTFTPTFQWTAVRGAQSYYLQYTTNIDGNFNSNVTQIITNNTSYTPTLTLPNDVDYFWRVSSHSGASVSDWTPAWKFKKRWYIKPKLLTPTLNYQNQRFPFFSWAPVPGASYYKVDVSLDIGFTLPLYDTGIVANTFYSPTKYTGTPSSTEFFWRVTPYDGDAKMGVASNTWSYKSYTTSVAPHQVYPLYYYAPDAYDPEFADVTTNPHEDRTVALPIFIWHRVSVPATVGGAGGVYATNYRVQVDDNAFFNSIEWQTDTQNTVAAPTASNPFTPVINTTYYWRVCVLEAGVCGETNQPPWSQKWTVRFDPSKKLAATTGAAPALLRPTDGYEYGESTPLLEWFPLSGATSYDVEISPDQAFSSIVDTATVINPAYAPTQSLAQRNLGAVDFGVYYWRVRQSPSGTWTSPRRFQIAAQSQWQLSRSPGNVANQLQIGSDPSGDVSADYDLTDLNATQDVSSWYFGFHVPSAPTQNVTYALYLDLDHAIGSGATTDVLGYSITTISAYRPEYVIYVLQNAGAFSASNVYLYSWNGSSLVENGTLSEIGGSLNYNSSTHYVEVKIASTSILGQQITSGSYAISLLSLPAGGSGSPQDSVPSDPNVPGAGAVSRFSSVTERMNLVAPPNSAGVDPSSSPSVLPVFWDWSISAPWAGANMNASLDPSFTNIVGPYTLTSLTANYARTSHSWGYDLIGDNTYFWRIQPRYFVNGIYYTSSSWSQAWSFIRKGFTPKNLKTSVTFATPVFSWDVVEGAKSYDLEVDDDPNFNTPAININTKLTSYTSLGTLPKTTYYWRVRVRRYTPSSDVVNGWTNGPTFLLNLPKPNGLTPANTIVARSPTLCWNPVIQPTVGTPVFAAWKYRVQISKDPLFSTIINNGFADTEQSCWTPLRGFDDGKYYWHVAIFDGAGKLGDYTGFQTFTKQYPKTTLLSPTTGSSASTTPKFRWSPVNGAASYKFEVSLNSNFAPILDSAITDSVTFTPLKKYTPGSTYYWRVSIVDKDGKLGPASTATLILTLSTLVAPSAGPQDGWILESSETSGKGGTLNPTSTTLMIGDDAAKKQYVSILSFNTGAGLPDNAVITGISLNIKKAVGSGNPLTAFQGITADVKNGFFGTAPALELTDFNIGANQSVGPAFPGFANNIYSIDLTSAKGNINKLTTGNALTQIRLRFKLDDNNDALSNFLSFYSGNATAAADRPQLVIKYYIP